MQESPKKHPGGSYSPHRSTAPWTSLPGSRSLSPHPKTPPVPLRSGTRSCAWGRGGWQCCWWHRGHPTALSLAEGTTSHLEQVPIPILPRVQRPGRSRASDGAGQQGQGTQRGQGPRSYPDTHASDTTYLAGSGAQGTLPIRTAPTTSLKRRPRFLPRMVSRVPPSSGPCRGSICGTRHRSEENHQEASCLHPCACAHVPLDPREEDRIAPHAPAPPSTMLPLLQLC